MSNATFTLVVLGTDRALCIAEAWERFTELYDDGSLGDVVAFGRSVHGSGHNVTFVDVGNYIGPYEPPEVEPEL